MGDLKHLVLVKFKEGVVVEDIIQGMTKLVSSVDLVKSFEWGQDVGTEEMLRQGFTHAFMLTFKNSEDLASYVTHPSHLEFAIIFSAAIEKVMLFDFPSVIVKP
ncbi:uncharacterized protein A4U43_C04F6730 [Asparagus officinalis]|uniref:Stress-response A/B barrel domain-containing protein n=1 Tax=Asparagus officinalis TaxID=4686 RepID=A0A5P1EYR1_ASPOF|nr:stress-response A/B barrel domain-containing protein At5g22580 [Asparagus officinalis]ONK71268.1 uncharacterized protein A4U43_C04F6730 [Asparagus officinalis]